MERVLQRTRQPDTADLRVKHTSRASLPYQVVETPRRCEGFRDCGWEPIEVDVSFTQGEACLSTRGMDYVLRQVFLSVPCHVCLCDSVCVWWLCPNLVFSSVVVSVSWFSFTSQISSSSQFVKTKTRKRTNHFVDLVNLCIGVGQSQVSHHLVDVSQQPFANQTGDVRTRTRRCFQQQSHFDSCGNRNMSCRCPLNSVISGFFSRVAASISCMTSSTIWNALQKQQVASACTRMWEELGWTWWASPDEHMRNVREVMEKLQEDHCGRFVHLSMCWSAGTGEWRWPRDGDAAAHEDTKIDTHTEPRASFERRLTPPDARCLVLSDVECVFGHLQLDRQATRTDTLGTERRVKRRMSM